MLSTNRSCNQPALCHDFLLAPHIPMLIYPNRVDCICFASKQEKICASLDSDRKQFSSEKNRWQIWNGKGLNLRNSQMDSRKNLRNGSDGCVG